MQPVFVDRTELWREVQVSLAAERLRLYRSRADADPIDALARYLWNMSLCEALYPPLQGLELALRNTLHKSISARTGNPFWWDDASIHLGTAEQQKVDEAKARLSEASRPYEADQTVSELTFGFWTGLLAREYETSLVIPIIRAAFPFMPSGHRTRRTVAERCWNARVLRNRVFHHEPIWNRPDLGDRHEEVLEAIGWISPTLRALVAAVDRFDLVLSDGWQPYRSIIEAAVLQA